MVCSHTLMTHARTKYELHWLTIAKYRMPQHETNRPLAGVDPYLSHL